MADETDPAKSGQSQDGRDRLGRFAPGFSGNPAGVPRGTRHKASRLAEQLIDEAAGRLTEVCIEKAFDGDPVALRLVMERLLSPRRARPVAFDLPAGGEGASSVVEAVDAVLAQVAAGELTPDEGTAVVALIEAKRRAIETEDLAARIAALEERNAK